MRLGRKKDAADAEMSTPAVNIVEVLSGAYDYVTRYGKSPHHAALAKAIRVAQNLAEWTAENDPVVWTEDAPDPVAAVVSGDAPVAHVAPEAP